MVLLESENIQMGEAAVDFALEGIDGQEYSLASFGEAQVLVVIFMCNHCPYVQKIWDGLVELASELQPKGVAFVGINPNTANPEYEEENMEKMREYAQQYGMNFAYLEDVNQKVARAYRAQCTPDIYVYDDERKLAYHGRFDNDELKVACEELLAGERPSKDEQRPSMGCSIKWVE